MDSALILLLRLRFWGWLRRIGRKLGTARGLLLTAVGLSLFLPSIISMILVPTPPKLAAGQIEGFRRIGPIFLLIYCLVTLLFSPGDKAFAFSPAEVSFLFPAPFSRRTLLAYKIGGNIGLVFLTAIFMTFAFRQYASTLIAGYLGVVLAFAFLQLFAMAVTLAGQAIGARATSLRRRLALGLIVGILGATALSVGWREIRQRPTMERLRQLERSPGVAVALAPFRPFIRTISSDRVWPDLFLWGGISLAIDAALVAAVLALDAQYLEAAAASSERHYARLERMRKGTLGVTSRRRKKAWKEVPAFPWWGGLGPILWRQITMAGRDYARALAPFIVALLTAGFGVFLASINSNPNEAGRDPISVTFTCVLLSLSIFLSPMITFDFRGDIDRIEGLKTLPMAPWRLALGQLVTPTLLLTLAQLLGLLVLASGTWPVRPWFWAIAAFTLPLNVVLMEVENLMFLWFPTRPMSHTPGDIQAMGRLMLLAIAKAFVLFLALGLATAFGFLAWLILYWTASASAGLIAWLIVAWLVLAGMSVAFVPMIAAAFKRFDVASEMPA